MYDTLLPKPNSKLQLVITFPLPVVKPSFATIWLLNVFVPLMVWSVVNLTTSLFKLVIFVVFEVIDCCRLFLILSTSNLV